MTCNISLLANTQLDRRTL